MVSFNRDIHCILGLPFDAITLAGAVELVRNAASSRQPCLLSTPNLSFLVSCLSDRDFRDSVIHSDLSVADGMPLVWVARVLGIPIKERVAGSGLFEALCDDPATYLSVYFFGGPEGVAEQACRSLNARGGGVTCVGHGYPGFASLDEMSSESILGRINASGANFLVVALGARKGQAWIARNRARLHAPVISHLGAVVNFVAGTVRRAPVWMQRVGLEWLWRILEEPALFRRYWHDGWALLRLLVTRVAPYVWYLHWHRALAGRREETGTGADVADVNGSHIITLSGVWTQQNLAPLRGVFSKAASLGKEIRLDLSEVSYVDSAFIGLVVLLYGCQVRRGLGWRVMSVQQPVRRVIRYCCAGYLLED